MKKFFTLIGAFMLFCISAVNASITVNFNFTGMGGEAYQYVDFAAYDMEGNSLSDELTSNNASITFDEVAEIYILSSNQEKYSVTVSLGPLTYEQFNEYQDGALGTIIYEYDVWDIILLEDEELNNRTFTVAVNEIGEGDSGNTGEGNDTPPAPEGEKTVNLNVISGDYSLLTGMVWYSEGYANSGYIEFDSNTLSYSYMDYIGINLYSGDNSMPDINVVCDDSTLEKGTDYELYEEDGAWFITLTASAPEEITFNITAPGETPTEKTVNLNVISGDYSLLTGMVWYYEGYANSDYIEFDSNTLSYTYTDYIGMNLYSNDNDYPEIFVICSDDSLEEGKDYELYEEDGVWFITLNSETPEDITFNISFPAEEVENPTVTLNFTGEGIVEGLSVYYQNWDDSSENTYSPSENPFTFEVSAESMSYFEISAEGYIIEITLDEQDAMYADNLDINGSEVTLFSHDMNLTFNVNVTKKVVPVVTLEFTGETYEEGMITVLNGTEELEIIDGELDFSYASQGSLTIEAPVSTELVVYTLTFSSDVEEGADTYLVSNDENVYYLTLYPGMNGKTITVTLVEDESSGIESVLSENGCQIYNLRGLKVNDVKNLEKGIYIINGKKVMIKK